MIYVTKSGSQYEISADGKQVRVLRATNPAARVGAELNTWRPIDGIWCGGVGFPLCIAWPEGTTLLAGSPESTTPATVTSAVVEIRK